MYILISHQEDINIFVGHNLVNQIVVSWVKKLLLLFCQFKHSFVQPAGFTANELNRTKMQDKSNPFLDLRQVEK